GAANPFGPRVAVKGAHGWRYEDNPRGGVEVFHGSLDHRADDTAVAAIPPRWRTDEARIAAGEPIPEAAPPDERSLVEAAVGDTTAQEALRDQLGRSQGTFPSLFPAGRSLDPLLGLEVEPLGP